MARALGAMVDKFRSDMVDYYLNSWFNHKKSNSVVILRDGLVDTSKFKIDSMEVHSDCIVLKFSPSTATAVQNSTTEKVSCNSSVVRPIGPSVPVDYSLTDDDDDETVIYEATSSRASGERPANWRSAYSMNTVDSDPDGGIEMRVLSREDDDDYGPLRVSDRSSSTQF